LLVDSQSVHGKKAIMYLAKLRKTISLLDYNVAANQGQFVEWYLALHKQSVRQL
jgi:hypothetical protein